MPTIVLFLDHLLIIVYAPVSYFVELQKFEKRKIKFIQFTRTATVSVWRHINYVWNPITCSTSNTKKPVSPLISSPCIGTILEVESQWLQHLPKIHHLNKLLPRLHQVLYRRSQSEEHLSCSAHGVASQLHPELASDLMGLGAAGASQAFYDGGFQNVAAAQQLTGD